MRYMILLVIVLACMATTIRLDGVWPPEQLRQQLEVAAARVIAPGQALISQFERKSQPLPGTRSARSIPRLELRLPLPRAVAGGAISTAPTTSTCG